MRRIFNCIFIIVLIIFLIILGNVCYSKFILKEEVVSIFGKCFFIVETGSMEPTIKPGELIITSKVKEYKEGDIVTVLDNSYIYTHRIISINNENIVTKGDNNDIEDEVIENSLIIGKVIFHSKILGLFVSYALKPITAIYIVFVFIRVIKDIFMDEEEQVEEKNINN